MKTSEKNPAVENEAAQPFEQKSAIVSLGAEPQIFYPLVAQQDFLKGMAPRQLEQLAESALRMQFEAGQQIFREGDQANRFFIILKGRVLLESEGEDGSMIPIQTLGPGDDLGWSWLFEPYYLHFNARTIEPTDVLFFYATRLRQQCEEDPALGYELMKRIAKVVVRRLEATQRAIR
jgi:CRP-like cAMP-binding protein